MFRTSINYFIKIVNPDKYHLFLSEKSDTQVIVENVLIPDSNCKKLLEIKINEQLFFEPHVEPLCKNASQKLNALSWIASPLKFEKRKSLNAFITAQFSYAPIIWMFHSRRLKNRINLIHERTLRLICKYTTNSFDEFLSKDNSFQIHQRNLQKLAFDIFKVKLGSASGNLKNVF